MKTFGTFSCCALLGAALLIGCRMVFENPAPFEWTVFPSEMTAIPEQNCVFLIKVADSGQGIGQGEAVILQAKHPHLPLLLTQTTLLPGEVGELHIKPTPEQTASDIVIELLATRKDLTKRQSLRIHVVAGQDLIAAYAAEIRDRFVAYLEAHQPALNIHSTTLWQGTIVNPTITIIAYYLFFSEEWEMDVCYHVMIPPHDWARIYLRRRHEWSPSYAFAIASLSTNDPPYMITPPENVVR